ncbi:MAG: M28 family peptidase, partial [Coriobacteriia bacterium]|nr:M28 family peptidase [Coriobacteriia bacterium]
MADELIAKAASHVATLCGVVPDRHPGSAGNAAAVDYFEAVVRTHGWDVDSEEFDCLEWEYGDSWIEAGGVCVALHTGPYSLQLSATAPLATVSTIEELEAGDFAGKVLLLHGPIASEQLFPKNFAFYNPASHKRVYAALERQSPAAVIAATTRNPEAAGAVYPFPLIEDGDFDIPNAFMTYEAAEPLLALAGAAVRVRVDSRRIPATGRHLVARKPGTGSGRIVVFAHIDGRKGIPAALDNASGAASLLVLAGLLEHHVGPHTVEIVPLNGEDYYGANGQNIWMRDNRERLAEIVLGMNADDSGHVGHGTYVSFYGCPPETDAIVRGLFDRYPGFG